MHTTKRRLSDRILSTVTHCKKCDRNRTHILISSTLVKGRDSASFYISRVWGCWECKSEHTTTECAETYAESEEEQS